MDIDEIARHAMERGHWPGMTLDEVKQIVEDVKSGWHNKHTASNGETIYRKGDTIVIENAAAAEGTVFEPSSNALEYFRRWVKRNPGGS